MKLLTGDHQRQDRQVHHGPGRAGDGRHRPLQEGERLRPPGRWCGAAAPRPTTPHGGAPDAWPPSRRACGRATRRSPPARCTPTPPCAPACPSPTAPPTSPWTCPACSELAAETGLPICGKDYKTGQTLIKTILAPGFKARLLGVSGWFSTNILGNRDGEVLDDPESFKTKEVSKLGVLEQILQPDVYPDLYGIDVPQDPHQLLPAPGDNKEGWDNIDIFGWMGYPMQIKVDFLCKDSILAAPIVLDLALFMDLAARAGQKGIQEWLSFYFKSPQAAPELYPENDLFIQHTKLKNTLRHWMGEDLITHLGVGVLRGVGAHAASPAAAGRDRRPSTRRARPKSWRRRGRLARGGAARSPASRRGDAMPEHQAGRLGGQHERRRRRAQPGGGRAVPPRHLQPGAQLPLQPARLQDQPPEEPRPPGGHDRRGRHLGQGRIGAPEPELLQGAGRLLRHLPPHQVAAGSGRPADALRRTDRRRGAAPAGRDHLRRRHRRQPRPRRGLVGHPAGLQVGHLRAQAHLAEPHRGHRAQRGAGGGGRRHLRRRGAPGGSRRPEERLAGDLRHLLGGLHRHPAAG